MVKIHLKFISSTSIQYLVCSIAIEIQHDRRYSYSEEDAHSPSLDYNVSTSIVLAHSDSNSVHVNISIFPVSVSC